jgi:hypothetical protein
MPTSITSRDLLFFALGLVAAWVFSRVRKNSTIQIRSAVHEPASKDSVPFLKGLIKTSVTKTFVVNGKTYTSLDDVPAPFREKIRETLQDKDGDGVPDIFQKK